MERERERKVSRLMGQVRERGLGRRLRADRASFRTSTSTGPPELNKRWTLPGHWKGRDFMLNVFLDGHILNQQMPQPPVHPELKGRP